MSGISSTGTGTTNINDINTRGAGGAGGAGRELQPLLPPPPPPLPRLTMTRQTTIKIDGAANQILTEMINDRFSQDDIALRVQLRILKEGKEKKSE